MKHLYHLLALLLALLLATPALADVITIDLETATYDELTAAYELLKAERIARLKETFAATHEIQPAEGITFRGIPWGSTRAEVEEILGAPDQTFNYFSVSPSGCNSDGRGLSAYYAKWTVAGYNASGEISYVYAVQDGQLLRDRNLGIMALGTYEIEDIGDVDATVDDLTTKLTGLYGACTTSKDTRHWTDANSHRIELYGRSSSVIIQYYHADYDTLVDSALQAIAAEKAEQEELLRIQNQNNTDGL